MLTGASRDLIDENAPVTDLGEHRLKDIKGPVSLFQLGATRFPPLKTISNTNLPRPQSSSYDARDSAFGTAASAMRAALPGRPGGERFRRHTSSASGTNANSVT